jgi:hypothetical protein
MTFRLLPRLSQAIFADKKKPRTCDAEGWLTYFSRAATGEDHG